MGEPQTSKKFYAKLESKLPKRPDKTKYGLDGVTAFRGIRLKEEVEKVGLFETEDLDEVTPPKKSPQLSIETPQKRTRKVRFVQ